MYLLESHRQAIDDVTTDVVPVQLRRHARILGTLPREQPGHACTLARRGLSNHRTCEPLVQGLHQVCRCATRHPHTRGEPVAANGGRVGQVHQLGIRTCVEPGAESFDGQSQRCRRTRGQQERHHLTSGIGRRCNLGRRFNDHVHVCAAETERTHRRERRGGAGPRGDCPRHIDRRTLQRDFRIPLRKVEVRHHRARPQGHRRLDKRRDTGRRFKMPDVGFDRSDIQRLICGAAFTVHRTNRVHLDRVTQRCARAVCFDVLNCGGLHARTRQGLSNHALLRHTVWRGESIGAAVLIDGRCTNNRDDRITITNGITEAFEHHHAAAFAAHVAVSARIKRLALAIGRQHPRL